MSVEAFSNLEKYLGSKLLFGFLGPMNMFTLEIFSTKTREEALSVTKRFIEKHLSTKTQPRVVDLQDEKIVDLFDEALKNMARNAVKNTYERIYIAERFIQSEARLSYLIDSLKPKSWKDYAKERVQRLGAAVSRTVNRSSLLKGGVDAAYYGLSRIGAISKIDPTENEVRIVLIEEDDDWHEVETADSYNTRILAILEKWQENPLIILEIGPNKQLIDQARDKMLSKVSSTNDQI